MILILFVEQYTLFITIITIHNIMHNNMHGKMTIFNGDETVMCVILCAIFTHRRQKWDNVVAPKLVNDR